MQLCVGEIGVVEVLISAGDEAVVVVETMERTEVVVVETMEVTGESAA